MFFGGLILSATLLLFAFWLHSNEQRGWPNESYDSERDQEHLAQRKRSRRRVHLIFAACGILILIATLAGPQQLRIFVGAWSCVTVGLFAIVALAALDAFRTHRYDSRRPRAGHTDD